MVTQPAIKKIIFLRTIKHFCKKKGKKFYTLTLCSLTKWVKKNTKKGLE